MKKNLLPFIILFIGLVITLVLVFHRQIFQQNAAVPVYTSLAVKGLVYTDTNKNGRQDAGEAGASNASDVSIELGLFSHACVQNPPTVNPSIAAPAPTCADGQQQICAKTACFQDANGQTVCSICHCVANSGGASGANPSRPPIASPTKVTLKRIGSWNLSNGAGSMLARLDQARGTFYPPSWGKCGDPDQVIPCTVNNDGTYTCIVDNGYFYRADVIALSPQGYIIDTIDPYPITADTSHTSAYSLDFGMVQGQYDTSPDGQPVVTPGVISPTVVTPTPASVSPTPVEGCIPRPSCLDTNGGSDCPEYIKDQPSSTWCQKGPATQAQSAAMLQFLNTALRKFLHIQ